MPTPEEITRHHEPWDPPEGERVRLAGGPTPGPVAVVAADPSWPLEFEAVAARVRGALGDRVLGLDHVGSTSVPGLPAKPVIDVDLTVADSADEGAYVPPLVDAGFRHVIRERGWHEHRVLTLEAPRTNLHVFSPDCPEVVRHLMFRDWLRTHPDDLTLYAETKLDAAEAATEAGEHVMDYNQRKQPVIHAIYDRMFRSQGLIT